MQFKRKRQSQKPSEPPSVEQLKNAYALAKEAYATAYRAHDRLVQDDPTILTRARAKDYKASVNRVSKAQKAWLEAWDALRMAAVEAGWTVDDANKAVKPR